MATSEWQVQSSVKLTSTTERTSATHGAELSSQMLVNAFRTMHLSRKIDDREVLLKRQNKIFFQISCAGHEAAQVAAGMLLRSGHDWVYPYYRDRALCLAMGMTPHDMFLQAFGAASDPSSAGRQMPSHWSSPALNIVTGSSPTGTQFVQGVGCAEGLRFQDPASDRVVLVCSGEGATSEGEFWEAMNAACLSRLPIVFLIEDNGYAISVPAERQTAGGNISHLLSGFPDLFRLEVDGTDLIASYRAMAQAFAYAREGHGPSFVHAHLVRLYSHSLSDDERLYKTASERAAEAQRDPVVVFSPLASGSGPYRSSWPGDPLSPKTITLSRKPLSAPPKLRRLSPGPSSSTFTPKPWTRLRRSGKRNLSLPVTPRPWLIC